MDPLIYTLIVGALAGWLAGNLVAGGGLGIIGNIVVGVIGAFIGTWLLKMLGVSFGASLVGQILTAAVGGAALLLIIGAVRKAR